MSTVSATVKRQEGNSLILRTNPTVGLIALTALTDNATPDTVDATFEKTFRYSTNGVVFSQWMPLILPNITGITLSEKKVFVAEINYTKHENPGANYLDVTEVQITATDGAPFDPKIYFDNSLFKRYFDSNDVDVLNWYVNVLEKLYDKGLLPNFLDRLDDFQKPDDFLALWGSVSKFFAFYVKLARVFSRFYENDDLIRDFLKQRGLNTSPEDTLEQLQKILETYYFEMAKRGTDRITSDGVSPDPDGELLRLIHYQESIDEFLYLPYRKHHFGWNLGNSSPLHKGLRINDTLNKVPWSKGYVDMASAGPFLTGGTIITDGDNKVANFVGSGSISFTGMKLDPRLDYEVTFRVKLNDGGNISLSLQGKDKDNNDVHFKSKNTGIVEDSFFENAVLSRSDKYLTIRVFIYNQNQVASINDSTNIRQGQNLIAPTTLVKSGLTLSVVGGAEIFDFRILPMQTEYSRGFIQTNHFISAWIINRNGEFSIPQLTDYIRRYLINYDSHIKLTNIGDRLFSIMQEPIDTLYWVGAGEYCQKVVWIGSDPSCELIDDFIWVPEEETSYCEQT
jgi:hypothetical protein